MKLLNQNLTRILNNLEIYKEHEKKLGLEKETLRSFINNKINTEDFTDMTYLEVKEVFNKIYWELSKENRTIIEDLLKNKKQLEYPLINDVHYYPILNELLPTITKENRIKMDEKLKECHKKGENFGRYLDDKEILNLLIDNKILEKAYVFKCTCGDPMCGQKILTQEQYDKFMYYHNSLKNKDKDDDWYDEHWEDGYLMTDCWNDGHYEVCDINDFNKHLNCIRYRVIAKPDTSLDEL